MLTLLLAATIAMGQSVLPDLDSQNYRMPIDSKMTLWADDSAVAPDLTGTAKLVLGYMNGPLGSVQISTTERRVILADVLASNLLGGFSYYRFRLGADVPIYLLSTSDFEPTSAGIGDLALDLKGTILDPATMPVGLALDMRMGFPTSSLKDMSLGSPGLVWEVSAVVDHHFGDRGLVAANIGYRHAPHVDQSNLDLKDALTYRLGAGYQFTDAGGASLDFAGRYDYGSKMEGTPLEVLGGGFAYLANSPLVLRGGLGTGLTRGVGSPVFRAILALEYRSREKEPEVDPDGDGYVETDACPFEPEDFDGWLDLDGCPERYTRLDVYVVDEAGDPVTSALVQVSSGVEVEQIGDGEFTLELEPGEYSLDANAEAFAPDSASLAIVDGPPMEQVLTLARLDTTGKVVITLMNTSDELLDGTWAWDEAIPLAVAEGRGETVVESGSHVVALASPGYVPASFDVSVPLGETVELIKVLERATGTLDLVVMNENDEMLNASWTADEWGGEVVGGKASRIFDVGTYTIRVQAEGYQPQEGEVTVLLGEVTERVVVLPVALVKVAQERIEIQGTIYFDTGKATIKPESFPLVNEIAQVMADHPELLKVRVEGHTDSRGSMSSNQKLSAARAASVVTYMTDKGIAVDRLNSVGFGEERPIDPAENAEAWTKNRRVELHIEERSDDDEGEEAPVEEAGSGESAEGESEDSDGESAPEIEGIPLER
jgi:outer membrane protein OmpA-like peptidoglycan-associated protein